MQHLSTQWLHNHGLVDMERNGEQPRFRALLKAGKALLVSTSDYSSQALRDILKASSGVLPEWRSREAWTEDTELEEIGHGDDATKRSSVLDLVGRRSLDILLAVQVWLELESTGLPPGFKETDRESQEPEHDGGRMRQFPQVDPDHLQCCSGQRTYACSSSSLSKSCHSACCLLRGLTSTH